MACNFTTLAYPVRVACLARVVCVELLLFFPEVESHAIEWFVACEHYWASCDHNNAPMSQLVRGKRRPDIIDDSFLLHVWHRFFALLGHFILLGLAIKACQWSNYFELKVIKVPIENGVAPLFVGHAQLVNKVVDVVKWVHMDILQIFIHLPLPSNVNTDGQELWNRSSFLHVCVIAAL